MKHTNFTKSLHCKLKAIIQNLTTERIIFPPINHSVEFPHQTPLTKENFDLIRETLIKENIASFWLGRAIQLLDAAYPAFIYAKAKENQVGTAGMFLDFIIPDVLVHFAYSEDGVQCGCAKPNLNLKEFLFDMPGLNKDKIPDAEAKSLASRQIGYLTMQIEAMIMHLSQNCLWVHKGNKLFGYEHYRIEIKY